jgi:hypothetical protein
LVQLGACHEFVRRDANLRPGTTGGKQQRQAVAAFLGIRITSREISNRMLLADNSIRPRCKVFWLNRLQCSLPLQAVHQARTNAKKMLWLKKKGRNESVAAFFD